MNEPSERQRAEDRLATEEDRVSQNVNPDPQRFGTIIETPKYRELEYVDALEFWKDALHRNNGIPAKDIQLRISNILMHEFEYTHEKWSVTGYAHKKEDKA